MVPWYHVDGAGFNVLAFSVWNYAGVYVAYLGEGKEPREKARGKPAFGIII
jgi:hypothetical protein